MSTPELIRPTLFTTLYRRSPTLLPFMGGRGNETWLEVISSDFCRDTLLFLQLVFLGSSKEASYV